ncbi:SDR family oxidoreductase [Phenylobacterium sp.]|uniref:SDR family oxidoreductase n=1 Tax=Phenylobacterium sp. TaxID=1871053 RepID=UPI00301C8489
MFETDLLQGKRVLVTGGGTGLGRSMGARFAELGADLVICGRRADVLEEAAGQLRRLRPGGVDVETQVCDLRDPEAVDAMMAQTWRRRPLDVLVNNAAANFIAQTHKMSYRAADSILNITLHGALYATMAAGSRWIEEGRRGTVLSILSTSVFTGRAFTTPSAMAKSGLLAMTRSLAVEWGPRGVRTVAIAPGPFPTPGAMERLRPGPRAAGGNTASSNPLGRVGEHAELANLAAFMISDAAGYINGEVVTIDGGQHLRASGAEDLLGWTDAQWASLRATRS